MQDRNNHIIVLTELFASMCSASNPNFWNFGKFCWCVGLWFTFLICDNVFQVILECKEEVMQRAA